MPSFDFNFALSRSEIVAIRNDIRAHQGERPRCIMCGLDFAYGAAEAALEEPIQRGMIETGDLMCFWCWDMMDHDPGEPSLFQYGNA